MSELVHDGPVLDPWTVMDLLRFARGRGDAALAELMAGYAREAADRVRRLQTAASSGEFELLEQLSHGLRGSSLAVAAVAVANCCARIESAAASRCPEAARLGIAELPLRLEEALNSLRRVLSVEPTESGERVP